MKKPVPILSAALLAVAALGLVAATLPGVPPANDNFSISSTSVELPADEQFFPDGPQVDVVNANCTACHSASMALTQPRFTAAKWTEIVTKMRDVYKAPIPDEDIAPVVAYLTAMSDSQASGSGR